MDIKLNEMEVRVIGCLIEKKITTPEYYPLSINSLTTACNQKSNREPVVGYDEEDVEETLQGLIEKGFITEVFGSGRVVKYRERFTQEMDFKSAKTAVITVLFLRGPQTAGEIRSRSARLHQFENLGEVQKILNDLATAENGPFIIKLEKEVGRKENRYFHLFHGEEFINTLGIEKESTKPVEKSSEIVELKEEIESLKNGLNELRNEFEKFKNQF
ncbi:MAG: YceH family protein [Melioribacteraceae bacterium]|nr:YceH family protein [Melioribacteraceae bacterium]